MALDKAYSHTVRELQLDNLRESLRAKYDKTRKSHDAMHEFMLLASKMFPRKGVSWHTRSAFLLYQWEAFDSAHRAFIEALCGYYNVAFVLLRSVLELLLRGAFFECLAHKDFRERSPILDKDRGTMNLKIFLNEVIKRAPHIADELEETAGGIYDKIAPIVDDPKFRPRMEIMVKQLEDWEIFDSITNADKLILKTYGNLSGDVHVIPDRTDVGKVLLLKPEDLFERKRVYSPVLD